MDFILAIFAIAVSILKVEKTVFQKFLTFLSVNITILLIGIVIYYTIWGDFFLLEFSIDNYLNYLKTPYFNRSMICLISGFIAYYLLFEILKYSVKKIIQYLTKIPFRKSKEVSVKKLLVYLFQQKKEFNENDLVKWIINNPNMYNSFLEKVKTIRETKIQYHVDVIKELLFLIFLLINSILFDYSTLSLWLWGITIFIFLFLLIIAFLDINNNVFYYGLKKLGYLKMNKAKSLPVKTEVNK